MENLNSVIYMNAESFLHFLPDNCIDLVVTSPPYALQRKNSYGGIGENDYPDWFFGIGKDIHRILKPTGSFVLNIKENVRNGKRSLYVLETFLKLTKIFTWSDTYIWNKTNPYPTGNKRRLKDGFEYIYWFTKSKDYKFFPNNVLVKTESKWLKSEKKRKNTGKHDCNNMRKVKPKRPL